MEGISNGPHGSCLLSLDPVGVVEAFLGDRVAVAGRRSAGRNRARRESAWPKAPGPLKLTAMIAFRNTSIYQVRIIELAHSSPLVFRTVKVPGDLSLGGLHEVIQAAMGWECCHLHQFHVGKVFYGQPDPAYGEDMLDEDSVALAGVVPRARQRLRYEYDFGDSWMHDLRVERVIKDEPDLRFPVCIDGAGACPPEDSGGIWGYQRMLEALKNPADEEHEIYVDWLGGSRFDPAAFDLARVNRRLKKLKF